MASKGNVVLIEEIVNHDFNDAVGKEFDADSGNSSKLPLVIHFIRPTMLGNMGLLLLLIFIKLLAEIDHEFGLDNSSQDEQDISNDVDFDDVVFDDVSFEDVDFDDVSFDDIEFDVVDFDVGIDDLNFEQELEEVLYYATYASSINGKSRDVPTWFNLFVVYDQPIDDEGGVVPFEVVPKEMVAEEIVYVEVVVEYKVVEETDVGSSGEDEDVVIPHEVYVAMVAAEGFFFFLNGNFY
ncbi:hypothetical protein Tco_1342259 [Tanacetum coccineum]